MSSDLPVVMSQATIFETIRKLQHSARVRKQVDHIISQQNEAEKVDRLSEAKRLARLTIENVEIIEVTRSDKGRKKYKAFNSIPHRADSSAPFNPVPIFLKDRLSTTTQ
jgi:hypothetical protein